MRSKFIIAVFLVLSVMTSAKKKAETYSQENYGTGNAGTTLTIKFEKGREHNHPLFAIWLADENGKFIETLYVSQTIGKGVFPRASRKKGHWMAGEIQRPASLPYWAHQRDIINESGTFMPTPKKPEVDGVTGATPQGSFIMQLKTSKPLNGKYNVMLELNQSWDWNEYWTNDKYPDDKEYKTSSQPALVYSVKIDTKALQPVYEFEPLGYSHYSGKDGSLTTDLSSITTALKIAKNITVTVQQ
jgi:hypothetical protein